MKKNIKTILEDENFDIGKKDYQPIIEYLVKNKLPEVSSQAKGDNLIFDYYLANGRVTIKHYLQEQNTEVTIHKGTLMNIAENLREIVKTTKNISK